MWQEVCVNGVKKLIGMYAVIGKMKGTDVEERRVASTQGQIACLSAGAQTKLLGEMVLLPQGLNGTLVRTVGTELLPRRCHRQPDFKEAVQAWASAPCTLFQTKIFQPRMLPQHLHESKTQEACCFLSALIVYGPSHIQEPPNLQIQSSHTIGLRLHLLFFTALESVRALGLLQRQVSMHNSIHSLIHNKNIASVPTSWEHWLCTRDLTVNKTNYSCPYGAYIPIGNDNQ